MRGKGRGPHAVASNEPDSPDVEQSSYFGCGARSHPSIALPGTPILPLQVTRGENDALLASAADHRLQHDHGLAEIAPPVRLDCKGLVMLKGLVAQDSRRCDHCRMICINRERAHQLILSARAKFLCALVRLEGSATPLLILDSNPRVSCWLDGILFGG